MNMELSKRIKEIEPSATLAISAQAKRMKAQGIVVVDFGAGEPDFETPSYIKEAGKASIDEGFTKYTPASGIWELKEAISEKLKKDNGLSYLPSEICISCGAKHALYNTFQVLCQEGDEVIVPSPYWVSYPEMVKLSGAKPVLVRTAPKNDFKLSAKLLESSITDRTKAIVLNSPSNPTGSVYSKDELEEVRAVATSHGIWVISDEVYEKIIYDGANHISIASLGDNIFRKTVVINGVSKTYSMTGWRIGYLASAKPIASAVGILQSHSTSNPASISQKAALIALKGGDASFKEMVGEFAKRRDYMMGRVAEIKGITPNKPRGAFYLFCDISKLGMDSVSFVKSLLEEEKVAVVPGISFGWDTHIRLSFATSMEAIKEGMDRIEKFVSRLSNQ